MVIRSVLISTVVLISFLVLTASGEDVLAQAEKGMDCLRCHQDQAGILETKHGAGADPGSPVGRGGACAACRVSISSMRAIRRSTSTRCASTKGRSREATD